MGKGAKHLTGHYVYFSNTVYLISEELHSDSCISRICRKYLHHISPDTKLVSHEIYIVSLILDTHKVSNKSVTGFLHTTTNRHHHGLILLRVTKGVDTRNAGDDNNVTAFGDSGGSGMSELIYLVINGAVLFDINVLARHIGFRLIIVIVGHEIFHGIVRKKLLELRTKLSGKYLIMGKHERWTVYPSNNVCHSKGLAGTSNAHKGLLSHAAFDTLYQSVHRLRLVAR